ncbi:MAG: glycosyltransferase involved in cell wall biosynthesis [Lentisphaeria bacterium]|jgi:glycosyltransferase involved in cell wall biosynthesis
MAQIGVVVIGRNEGDRLVRCLQSLRDQLPDNTPIVYVDSGSNDNSIANAKALEVHTIALDMSIPFTAARSRNTGFDYLQKEFPEMKYVQFLDGDCELVSGWMEKAIGHLSNNNRSAVVCGRRRERFPDSSPYNLMADMEWNTPVGDTGACGGDALIRVAALAEISGFNPRLICGEEPDMCFRLRSKGWKIFRLDAEMTLHDAAIFKFSQFWKRSLRGGWFVGEGCSMYGKTDERYLVKENRSGLLWGLIIPLLSLLLVWPSQGLSLFAFAGYPLLAWRVYQYRRSAFEDDSRSATIYAFLVAVSKFPQAVGQLQFAISQLRGKQATLIEYKS